MLFHLEEDLRSPSILTSPCIRQRHITKMRLSLTLVICMCLLSSVLGEFKHSINFLFALFLSPPFLSAPQVTGKTPLHGERNTWPNYFTVKGDARISKAAKGGGGANWERNAHNLGVKRTFEGAKSHGQTWEGVVNVLVLYASSLHFNVWKL